MNAIAEFFMGPTLNHSYAQMRVWCLLLVSSYANFSAFSTRPGISEGRENRFEDRLPRMYSRLDYGRMKDIFFVQP